jgi:hypothetical protein
MLQIEQFVQTTAKEMGLLLYIFYQTKQENTKAKKGQKRRILGAFSVFLPVMQ